MNHKNHPYGSGKISSLKKKKRSIKMDKNLLNNFPKNKYFKTFILSQYMFIKQKNIIEALEYFQDESKFKEWFDILIKYISGEDVEFKNDFESIEEFTTPSNNKFKTSYLNQMISAIKNTSQEGV